MNSRIAESKFSWTEAARTSVVEDGSGQDFARSLSYLGRFDNSATESRSPDQAVNSTQHSAFERVMEVHHAAAAGRRTGL